MDQEKRWMLEQEVKDLREENKQLLEALMEIQKLAKAEDLKTIADMVDEVVKA